MYQSGGGISIFFPALNDEKTIGALVSRALGLPQTLADDYEVPVVNDGSVDATHDVLEELARDSKHLMLVRHDRNPGYGAALRSGFGHASKELTPRGRATGGSRRLRNSHRSLSSTGL